MKNIDIVFFNQGFKPLGIDPHHHRIFGMNRHLDMDTAGPFNLDNAGTAV